MRSKTTALFFVRLLLVISAGSTSLDTVAVEPNRCADGASADCYFSFEPGGANGRLHYYASQSPDANAGAPQTAPVGALIAVHGHARDANKIFNAALLALQRANAANEVLLVAPLFQVAAGEAGRCQTAGVPAAQEGDLLWTCGTWQSGGAAGNGSAFTSFAAMDALIAELRRHWPGLRTITIAGFSAGAQMVQHYIGFAEIHSPAELAVRYVVADPGSWLYFDDLRPVPALDGKTADWSKCTGGADNLGGCAFEFAKVTARCPTVNRWKYGTDGLPALLRRSAAEARNRYAQADISYLEGALDTGTAPGASYKILDKSCAAYAQGSYRLQRGLAYAHYDRALLAPGKQRKVVVVPGCAHRVDCIFPAETARSALLGPLLPQMR